MLCLLILYTPSIIYNPWISWKIIAKIKELLYELEALVTEQHLSLEEKIRKKTCRRHSLFNCITFCKLAIKKLLLGNVNKSVQVHEIKIHSTFLGHIPSIDISPWHIQSCTVNSLTLFKNCSPHVCDRLQLTVCFVNYSSLFCAHAIFKTCLHTKVMLTYTASI